MSFTSSVPGVPLLDDAGPAPLGDSPLDDDAALDDGALPRLLDLDAVFSATLFLLPLQHPKECAPCNKRQAG
eukprot:7412595-Karenia_brevis.AAC.1